MPSTGGMGRLRLFPAGICWALLACAGGAALAAEPFEVRFADPILQPWRRSEYRELEGRRLRCLAEDPQGRIWFGLHRGTVVYDGRTWREFGTQHGLPEMQVRAVAAMPDGTVVAGLRSGVFRLVGQRWTKWFPAAAGTHFPVYEFARSSTGGVLAAGPWGVVELDGKTSCLYTSAEYQPLASRLLKPTSIRVIPDEHLPGKRWAVGSGVELVGRRVIGASRRSPAGAAGLKVGDRIEQMVGNSSGHINGLRLSVGKDAELTVRGEDGRRRVVRFRTAAVEGTFPTPATRGIVEDRRGRIWFGTTRGRILCFDRNSETWQSWSEDDGVQIGNDVAFLVADDDTIWAVSHTRHGGVNRFDGKQWNHERLSDRGGSDHNASIVQAADGTVWISGIGHLHAYRNEQWTIHATRDVALPGHYPRLLATANNSLWVAGYEQHVVQVAGNGDEFTSMQSLSYRATDTAGRTWLTESGKRLVCWDEAAGSAVGYSSDEMKLDRVTQIVANPAGGVVAAGEFSDNAAVSEWDGKEWTRTVFPDLARVMSFRSAGVAPDGTIWLMSRGLRSPGQVGGLVWRDHAGWHHARPPEAPPIATAVLPRSAEHVLVGSRDGVRCFVNGEWRRSVIGRLADESITGGGIDGQGVIWLGTRGSGLYRLADNDSWRRFDTADGLPSTAIESVVVTPAGEVWVSTAEGIARYDGSLFQSVDLPRELFGEHLRSDPQGRIWIAGRHRIARETDPPQTRISVHRLELNHGSSGVVSWRGTDPWNRTTRDRLRYSWRVDGGMWAPYDSRTELVLDGLAPGSHRLEVRVRDANLNVDPTPAVTELTVFPPVWRQTWFLATVTGIAGLFVWQTGRLVQRGLALRRSNAKLQDAQALLAEQYAEKTAQFRATCESSPTGIFVTDCEGLVTYVNPRLQALLAIDSAEAMGHGWAAAIHPADRERMVAEWQETVRAGSDLRSEARFLAPSGREVIFTVHATRIESDGQLLGFVGIVEDVTLQRKTAHALLESERRFRTIVETASEGIITLDREAKILFANERMGEMLGYERQELSGRVVFQFMDEADRDLAGKRFQQRLEDARSDRIECRFRHRDGSEVWVDCAATTLRSDNGRNIGMLGMLSDITLRRRAEEAQQRLVGQLEDRVRERTAELRDTNLELESFAHSVSHDLRAPLRAMEGFAAALDDDYGERLDDDGRDYIRHICDSARRMDALILDLLTYSQLGRSQLRLRNVDFDIILDQVLRQLESEITSRNALIRIAGELPSVYGHPATLVQVAANLISNAIKFVPPDRRPEVVVSATDAGSAVRLEFADNGIGIAPEYQDRVFRVFERLHGIESFPGTGIGLAIVSRACERLRGRCGVESVPGEGSRFWVEFPREVTISESERLCHADR